MDNLEFLYNSKYYILCELKVPKKNISYDIIAIFEIINDINYKFINYFYGVDEENEELINTSKKYIDIYNKMELEK